MTTFVLIHGAGSDGWYWSRVAPLLRERGHDVVAPDLPVDDDRAGLAEYAATVLDAAAGRAGVVLIAQSLGGFTAPLVADALDARLLVMLNAMTPYPGESPGRWWANTGWEGIVPETEEAIREIFLHDVPPEVAEASAQHVKQQSGTPFENPWPLVEWPDVPTRFLGGRGDRFFSIDFQRRVAGERLGADVDEIDGGHLVALSSPLELVERLERYLSTVEEAPKLRFR